VSAASAALWEPMRAAARDGVLMLQHCESCGCVQYPPRELCRDCLCESMQWRPVDGLGTVLAVSVLQVTNDARFRSRLPWPIATVKLDCDAIVFVNLAGQDVGGGARVRVAAGLDAEDGVVLEAVEVKGRS